MWSPTSSAAAGFGDLLAALRPLGRYVVAGAIAGPQVEADLRTIYLGQLTLLGSSFGTHEDFAAIVGLIAEETSPARPCAHLPAARAGDRPGRLRRQALLREARG